MIVRDGHAIPPRGSTELREGDELHVLVRGELREEVEELTERWTEGPDRQAAAAAAAAARRLAGLLGAARRGDGEDPAAPSEVDGIPVRRGAAQPPRRAPARWSRSPTAATR